MRPSVAHRINAELPNRTRLNRKKQVYTRVTHKPSSELPPRPPPPQNGLRIRLHQPGRGTRLRTAPWRIVVQDRYKSPTKEVIEQIGEYDVIPRWYRKPAPNLLDDGQWIFQKRLEWNSERLRYWIARGAEPTPRIIWLMQMTGTPLDPQFHRAEQRRSEQEELERLRKERRKWDLPEEPLPTASYPSPLAEYVPDVHVPNDPKHQERLIMRAKARQYRNVTLEPGSKEWTEAQMLRPEMQAQREFEAAQMEPYPLIPRGLKRANDPEPSRYARELPIWVAEASREREIDMRRAARGDDDISIPKPPPPWERRRAGRSHLASVARQVPPLEEPPQDTRDVPTAHEAQTQAKAGADLTELMQKLEVGELPTSSHVIR